MGEVWEDVEAILVISLAVPGKVRHTLAMGSGSSTAARSLPKRNENTGSQRDTDVNVCSSMIHHSQT